MERDGILMIFKKLRAQVKIIVIIVSVTFLGGMIYLGGSSYLGGEQGGHSARAAIATVNGIPITYHDFQQAYISQLQQEQSQSGRVDGRMLEIIKYRTFDSFVYSVLVEQEIKNRDISVSATEVNDSLAQIKAGFPDESIYRQQLQMAGLTEGQLKTLLEQDLQQEKLWSTVIGPVEISDEMIKEQYEEVRTSHILIRSDGDTEEAWAEAKEYAEFVLAQLAEMDFASAAKAFSDDYGSAEAGGDIGYVGRGDTVPEYEEVIFNMEINEVSGLVKSQFGYHIIKVTDSKLAEGEEFELAKSQIVDRLRSAEEERVVNRWLEELRETASVVINDKHLIAITHLIAGELEEAKLSYEKAIEETPEDGYLYASLGDVYLELDDIDSALAEYVTATEKIRNDGQLFFMLANLYQEAELEEEAVIAYLKASELMPNDFSVQLQVQGIMNQLGREEEADLIDKRIEELLNWHDELQKLQQQQNEQVDPDLESPVETGITE